MYKLMFIFISILAFQFAAGQLRANKTLQKILIKAQIDSYYSCHKKGYEIERDLDNNAILPPGIPQRKVTQYNISYLLYTPKNPQNYERITVHNLRDSLKLSNYDAQMASLIIVDGYIAPAIRSGSMLVPKVLPVNPINIFILDWDSYNKFDVDYTLNITIPRVGNFISKLVYELYNSGVDPQRVHLAGLSMGCQVISLGLKNVQPKPGRFLAMEPGGKCYNYLPANQRVDISDAQYVMIVHTSVGEFSSPLYITGHSTFYVNGGFYQEACLNTTSIYEISGCSHAVSADYFFDTFLNFQMAFGVKCKNYDEYLKKQCNCFDTAIFGYYSPNTVLGTYYVDSNPFQATRHNPKCTNYPFQSPQKSSRVSTNFIPSYKPFVPKTVSNYIPHNVQYSSDIPKFNEFISYIDEVGSYHFPTSFGQL